MRGWRRHHTLADRRRVDVRRFHGSEAAALARNTFIDLRNCSVAEEGSFVDFAGERRGWKSGASNAGWNRTRAGRLCQSRAVSRKHGVCWRLWAVRDAQGPGGTRGRRLPRWRGTKMWFQEGVWDDSSGSWSWQLTILWLILLQSYTGSGVDVRRVQSQ